jgi:hypothetical protein
MAGLIYQLDFADADLLVDARAVLWSGLRLSNRATNGFALLSLLRPGLYWLSDLRLGRQARKASVQTAY